MSLYFQFVIYKWLMEFSWSLKKLPHIQVERTSDRVLEGISGFIPGFVDDDGNFVPEGIAIEDEPPTVFE